MVLMIKNGFFRIFWGMWLGMIFLFSATAQNSLSIRTKQMPDRKGFERSSPRFKKISNRKWSQVSKIQILSPGIQIEHLTTHDKMILKPDVPGGKFSKKQQERMEQLLRCHHTGKRKRIDSRLLSSLYQIAHHHRNAKITVIAGYRAPEVALRKGNPRSPHTRGVACDFRLAGVSVENLRDYIRRVYHGVGVGYYPHSRFVHLDMGRKQSAYWVDASHPGQKARYVSAMNHSSKRKRV